MISGLEAATPSSHLFRSSRDASTFPPWTTEGTQARATARFWLGSSPGPGCACEAIGALTALLKCTSTSARLGFLDLFLV